MTKQFVVQRVNRTSNFGGVFKTTHYIYRVLELNLEELLRRELKGEPTYVKTVRSKLVKRVVKKYSPCCVTNTKGTAIAAETLCRQLNLG